jgi:hypothetical protein
MIRFVADALTQGVPIDGEMVIPHQSEPLHHIFARVDAGDTRRLSNAEIGLSPSDMQVFGDLRPGLAGTHD